MSGHGQAYAAGLDGFEDLVVNQQVGLIVRAVQDRPPSLRILRCLELVPEWAGQNSLVIVQARFGP